MLYDAYINYPHGNLEYAKAVADILQEYGISCYVPPDFELENGLDDISRQELILRIESARYFINIDIDDHLSMRYLAAMLLAASESSESITLRPQINADDIRLTPAEYAAKIIQELRKKGWYSKSEKLKIKSEDIYILSHPYDDCIDLAARVFTELHLDGYSVYYNPHENKTYEDEVKLETCKEIVAIMGELGQNATEKHYEWGLNVFDRCIDVAFRSGKHIIFIDVLPYKTELHHIQMSRSHFNYGMNLLREHHLRSRRINERGVVEKKVFIAGSKVLSAERKIVLGAINKVNTIPYFKNQGIVFTLSSFEDFEKELTMERKQEIYNQHIRNSSLLMVLVDDNDVGNFTIEELNTAYSSFYNDGKPFICVFHKMKKKNKVTPVLNKLQEMMASIQQYYVDYRTKSELETLCILMLFSIFGHDGIFGQRVVEQ